MKKTPSQWVIGLNNLSDKHVNELQQCLKFPTCPVNPQLTKPTANGIPFLWNSAPAVHLGAHVGNLGQTPHFRMQSRAKVPVCGVAVFAIIFCFCESILHFISERQS